MAPQPQKELAASETLRDDFDEKNQSEPGVVRSHPLPEATESIFS